MTTMEFLKFLLDIIIPRFVEDTVALVDRGDHFEILCVLDDVGPDDQVDAIAKIRAFNFFGFALFGRMVEGSLERDWGK